MFRYLSPGKILPHALLLSPFSCNSNHFTTSFLGQTMGSPINGLLPKPISRRNTVSFPAPLRVFTHYRLELRSIRKLAPLSEAQTVRIVLRNVLSRRVGRPKMLEVATQEKFFRPLSRKISKDCLGNRPLKYKFFLLPPPNVFIHYLV
jgi:hypothetical protein